MKTTLAPTTNIDSQERLSAALSYIFFLIPLVFDKKTDYVSFHMIQSFGLFLIALACTWIPLIGWIVNIVLFFLMLFLMWKAYSGERFALGGLYEAMYKLIQKVGMTQIFFAKK